MHEILIHNLTRPKVPPLSAHYCDSFLCRLRGLMFRRSIPDGWGLMMVQSRENRIDAGVTMFATLIDLGVVWINSQGKVVDTQLARSWRLAYIPQAPARYTLEMNVAHLDDFSIGDHIQFERKQT